VEACNELLKSDQSDPRNGSYLYYRAIARSHKKKKYSAALKDFEDAKKLFEETDPNMVTEIHSEMIQALQENRDPLADGRINRLREQYIEGMRNRQTTLIIENSDKKEDG
jgi:hypothetical protein